MRVLLRIFAWAVVACVVLVIAVAVTNEPPQPYVRIDDFRVSPTYITRIECVDGFELQTYAREGEGELPPVLTDRPCASNAPRH